MEAAGLLRETATCPGSEYGPITPDNTLLTILSAGVAGSGGAALIVAMLVWRLVRSADLPGEEVGDPQGRMGENVGGEDDIGGRRFHSWISGCAAVFLFGGGAGILASAAMFKWEPDVAYSVNSVSGRPAVLISRECRMWANTKHQHTYTCFDVCDRVWDRRRTVS